ncbi:MAG: glycosyltransferase [Roseiarcus sp.]
MNESNVIVNLSRWTSAGDGSGGAGWFGLFFARSASKCADVTVFVSPRNRQQVADFLRQQRVRYHVVDDIESAATLSRIARAHIYVDPLNGLEPAEIPSSVFAIAVIHDLMFQDCPYFFSDAEIRNRALNYGSSIARADLLLTTSPEQVEKIRKLYGKTSIDWIAQFCYFDIDRPSSIRPAPTGRFLLYPGVQWNHKNHFRLIAAFLGLCERGLIDDDVSLVISRIRPVEANSQLHLELLSQSRLGHRVKETPYLTPPDYAGFMRAALGVVFPTLYEGYGIPVVEAIANGKPILTSRTPSYANVADPPSFVRLIDDPEDIGAVARALRAFIMDTPVGAPRPEAIPTAAAFDARVANLLAEAGRRPNRGEARLELAGGALPRRPRRSESLTLHLFADSLDRRQIEAVGASIARAPASLPISAVVHAPFDELVEGDSRAPPPAGVRLTARDPLARGTDIVLAHELALSPSRFSLVLPIAEAESLSVSDLAAAIDLLRLATAYNALEVRRGAGSLAVWGASAELLRGYVLDLQRLAFDFDTLHEGLYENLLDKLKVRTRSPLPTFLVCDPALVNLIGHHVGVARALVRGARALGYRVAVGGNKQAQSSLLAPDAVVHPIFDDYFYGGATSVEGFVAQLEGIASRELVDGAAKVTLFCATPAMLAGAMAFLLARPPRLRPTFLIRFDRGESRVPRTELGYAECFRLLHELALARHFHFFAESKGLQAYFEDVSGFAFELLFNPIENADARLRQIGVERADEAKTEFTITYLGEARSEKGFQYLPVIVDYVLTQCRAAKPVRFRIQAGASRKNETEDIVAAREALELMSQKHERVELLGFLDDAAYAEALHSADAIVMPYVPTEYVMRGSGVATEAAAAGKPFVVSRGVDIQATFEPGGVVAPDTQNEVGFAEAVCRLVENYGEHRQRAERFRDARPDLFGDEVNMVSRLIQGAPMSDVEPKYVLWLSNDTRGEGSGIVYESQLSYLRSRGFVVVQLVIPYPNHNGVGEQEAFEFSQFFRTLTWRPSFEDVAEFHAIADRIALQGNSYDNFASAWRHLRFPEALAVWLGSLELEFIVVNYAHHAAVLDTLGLSRAAPRIVETHDIQAYQYALQQRRDVDPAELDEELSALASFDHLVSISATETRTFETLGKQKVTWCLPYLDATPRGALLPRPFDILVVGSSHDANVASIRWFIQNVYKPVLYKEGLTLAVVGSVCSRLDSNQIDDRVTYFGRVEHLHPYYEAAMIVALPIISGAGVPIKALDAFARGKPFSLTSFPAAALGLPEGFPVADSAYAMARDILDLCDDAEKREQRARIGREFYEAYAAEPVYRGKWDAIVRAVAPRSLVIRAPQLRRREKLPATALRLGQVYELATASEIATAFAAGWYHPEEKGLWSGEGAAKFECALPIAAADDIFVELSQVSVSLNCRVFGTWSSGSAVVEIGADAEAPTRWTFEDDELQTRIAILPVLTIDGRKAVKFSARRLGALSPAEIGGSGDPRKLGLWVGSVSFNRYPADLGFF